MADLTEDKVVKHLKSQSLAANSGKVDALLESVPDAGIELVWTETKQRHRFDRKQMREILEAFYRNIDPATYVYGVEVESITLNEDGSASVVMSVSEAYRHKESGELRSTRYREIVTMAEENGRVIVSKAEMEARKTTTLGGPKK
ncbi:hypothetical protein OKA05_10385 [Luteolibacter arcticus]|uniref:SnoaL-like domain-containing protein n=1 Tax=Luteolibacter arcticus TaxID=1581411 RepID=A0ABT3GHR3_9BACT|nr:hypothetical protein [Luteolibacter arcticus]MCW1922959.1 hypothetical protein [Luteolibacter arcticus]